MAGHVEMMKQITAGLFAVACLHAGVALADTRMTLTENVVRDPNAAVFVYRDVENFQEAYDAIRAGEDPAKALETLYFDRGTPGLAMFVEKYGLTVERLTNAISKRPDEYARIGSTLEALRAREPEFRKMYAKITDVVPEAAFPPTYFVVAGYRGIGSGSVEGPLISIEKETPESVKGDLKATLVHEMIHLQQLAAVGDEYFAIFSGEGRTLLANSIREGGATFFAELIAGGSEHKNKARDYYLEHEAELWPLFREDMLGGEMGDWLWSAPSNPDQPRDVGYAIGARIVEVYYRNTADKREAASRIMSVTDYPAFLELSGYEADLARRTNASD